MLTAEVGQVDDWGKNTANEVQQPIAVIAVVAIATHGQGRELQERPCAHEPSLVGFPVS